MDGDADELVPVDPLADLRRLDVARQGRNRIDADFHVVHELREVDLLFGQDVNPAVAFGRCGADPLDGIQVADRLFDARDDLLLDFLRRRARPEHLDLQPWKRTCGSISRSIDEKPMAPATKIPTISRLAATEFRAHHSIR